MTRRRIVIGDLHGCLYTLKDILKEVEFDKGINKGKDELIFLGDYIDRGNWSYELVTFLIELEKKYGKNRIICLMGNHEKMFIDSASRNREDITLWMYNGGNNTLDSFEDNNKNIYDYLAWFKDLAITYSTEKYIFCHAGIPHTKIEDNTVDDILWGRTWLKMKPLYNDKTVIFGHTPFNDVTFIDEKHIGIDLGCVFGLGLCACIIQGEKELQFVKVPTNPKDKINRIVITN